MSSATNELYQQVILDHNKNPRNFKPLENPTCLCEGHNPLCGDHVTVFVNLEDETLKDITFTGDGCSICKASASLMTTFLKGKTRTDARVIFDEFHRMVKGELDVETTPHHLGRLTVFQNVSNYPVRVKCASLAWHALNGALDRVTTTTTE